MRIVGCLFLVIALAVAGRGWMETGDDTSLALDEKIATENIERHRDQLKLWEAAVTGDKATILQITDPKLRQTVIETLRTSGPVDPRDATPMIISKQRDLTEAEKRLTKAKETRSTNMKWHYVPAACLGVLGVILFAIPAKRFYSSSDASALLR